MSSEKVARLLTDFDREPDVQRSRVVPFDHLQHSNPKPLPRPPAPPVVVDDGYERGHAEGYASVVAEYEQKLEYEREQSDARLEEERHHLLNEFADRIARDL